MGESGEEDETEDKPVEKVRRRQEEKVVRRCWFSGLVAGGLIIMA